jgi:hypothetical protein
MDELERRVQFLRSHQADLLGHSGGDLLSHLLGTRDLLLDWGERPAVCDAGLFHSVYSTEHYQPAVVPVSLRGEVRELVGPEAEGLAWLFCVMHRDSFDENLTRLEGFVVKDRLTGDWVPLSEGQFLDLVTLSFANTLEALPRLPWHQRRACRAYLRRFRGVAAPAALLALDRADAGWWAFWR